MQSPSSYEREDPRWTKATQFVRPHEQYLRGICRKYVNREPDAQDAFQEGQLRVYAGLHTFNGSMSPRAWLRAVFKHAAIDQNRTRPKRERPAPSDLLEDVAPTSSQQDFGAIDDADTRAVIKGILLRMPEEWRIVLLLYLQNGYTYTKIAYESGIPLKRVRDYATAALAYVRRMLEF